MARECTPFNRDYANRLRMLHEGGRSLLSLSKEFGHQRKTIQTWIERVGGTVRNRSDAMFVRMKNATPEQRQNLARAAHDAVRGTKRGDQELLNRALAKCCLIGHGEAELLEALNVQKLPTEAQRPCGKYNIDIAVGENIAVEIVTQGNYKPTSTRFRERFEYLHDRGWCMICVTFRCNRKDALIGNLDDVVAFIQRAYRSPAIRRKDWVIWCRSERFARIRNDLGQIAAVKVPERFFNVVGEVNPR